MIFITWRKLRPFIPPSSQSFLRLRLHHHSVLSLRISSTASRVYTYIQARVYECVCVYVYIPAWDWCPASVQNTPHTPGTLYFGGDGGLWISAPERSGVWRAPRRGRNTADPSTRRPGDSKETEFPSSPALSSIFPPPEKHTHAALNAQ